MTSWYVTVTANVPYPWSKQFTIHRSNAGAAASEAVKLYRAALKEKFNKAKKLDEISIKIVRGQSDTCG